jgi:hypothetical protein
MVATKDHESLIRNVNEWLIPVISSDSLISINVKSMIQLNIVFSITNVDSAVELNTCAASLLRVGVKEKSLIDQILEGLLGQSD